MDFFQCFSAAFLWIITVVVHISKATMFEGFPRKALAPVFYSTSTNVTYQRGNLAVLFCSIENLGTKTVIWRKQPYNVPITVGLVQFVEIKRFCLNHIPHGDQWNMVIKNVQLFDAGTYECQISSREKLMRRNITLNVVERGGQFDPVPVLLSPNKKVTLYFYLKAVTISGTRFVEKGSRLFLVCNASGSKSPPDDIDWFKNGNLLSMKQREDLKIEKQLSFTANTIVSSVVISRAYLSDSGTYVCRTPGLQSTSFKVDVLNADTNNVKREYDALSEGPISNNINSGRDKLTIKKRWIVLQTVIFLIPTSRWHR